MVSQVAKWGNSQGLRIDKNLLQSIGLRIGDKVEIIRGDNTLILKPQQERSIEYYLQDYERPEDTSWVEYNEPRGREAW